MLPNQFVQDIAVHIGQPEIAAAKTVGQFLVIETQQMQDRGMQIMDLDALLDRFVTKIVGGAPGHAATNTAPGQPTGEAKRIVIPAIIALGKRSPAKFA